MFQCLNKLMQNPGTTDRIQASKDHMKYYDSTLSLDPGKTENKLIVVKIMLSF